MWYIFNNETNECIMSSNLPLEVSNNQTTIESNEIYNIWEIRLQDNQIVSKPKQELPDTPTDQPIDTSTRFYRIAHGDFIPQPFNHKDYTTEIIAMQLNGDNFNSPNIGIDVPVPEILFYNGVDFKAGITNDGQVYISNGKEHLDERVTGWISVMVKPKL